MTSMTWKALAVCALSAMAAPSGAQERIDPVAVHSDWAVYVAGSPKECYVMTQPKNSDARRGGASVQVERGVIRLFVSFRPSQNVANEVSFSAGYPLAETVRVEVGSETFSLSPGTGDFEPMGLARISGRGRPGGRGHAARRRSQGDGGVHARNDYHRHLLPDRLHRRRHRSRGTLPLRPGCHPESGCGTAAYCLSTRQPWLAVSAFSHALQRLRQGRRS